MKRFQDVLLIMTFLGALVCLGYLPQQSNFHEILVFGALAFSAYCLLVFKRKSKFKLIVILGVLARLLLLFAFPNLSDDIYRFLWDGHLISEGYNPYGYLPSDFADQMHFSWHLNLFEKMNSPNYYTIYPPASQFIFYLATLFGDKPLVGSIIIKLIFVLAEGFTLLGIYKILKALKKPTYLAGIYFLNPLVIIEGLVNLHFEILMVSFLIWAVYFLFIKNNFSLGALLIAISIAFKLLPLIFLPFMLFKFSNRQRFKFFSMLVVFLGILFVPIYLGVDFTKFGSSIDLYFQKFEFNGSVYYILRFMGKLYKGYNMIHFLGPLLGVSACGLIMYMAIKSKNESLNSFLSFAFFSFLTYLFLATTIHPWYLISPILLSVFVKWRFVVLWSFLILLTYINYSYEPFHENLLIVAIEYILVVGFFIFEYKGKELRTLT